MRPAQSSPPAFTTMLQTFIGAFGNRDIVTSDAAGFEFESDGHTAAT